MRILIFEKTEWVTKNVQSRDTGTFGHKTKTNKTTNQQQIN
jgi:hypothetical protein